MPADATSLAEMEAVNCVLPTKAESLLLPFHWTTDPVTKLVPVMVNLRVDEPAVTLLGESVLKEGAGLFMVKDNALEAPPPGVGLNTVTWAAPADATSLAEMEAVSCVALANVVGRLLPFHCTIESVTKFEPLTVRVKPAPPACAAEGESELAVATPVGCQLAPPLMLLKTVPDPVPA